MDININLELLYFINRTICNGNTCFDSLKTAVNNVDISGSDLSSAYLLDEVKSSVSNISSSYVSIGKRVLEIKNLFEKNDAGAELLFNYLDGMLTEFDEYVFENDETFKYILNFMELLKIYQSGELDKLRSEKGTWNMYFYQEYLEIKENGEIVFNGEKYVKDLISLVQSNYSGREAAVNSVLLILGLAADRGVKLDYQHKSGMGLNDVLSGLDCVGFVCWAIDQGATETFDARAIEAFRGEYSGYEVGPVIDFSSAQPGDIFINNLPSMGGGGHIGIIVANDTSRGVFIVAEAANDKEGIILRERSYDDLNNDGYHVRDMGQFYD